MNRNIKCKKSKIAKILSLVNSVAEMEALMTEIFTESELETLSKRWQIIEMLSQGVTQREIAKELKVSLCKVTRGSHILKKQNSVAAKYLIKEKENESKQI